MSTKEKDDNGDRVPVSRLWETAISIAHCAWNSWTSLKSSWLNNPCRALSSSPPSFSHSCFLFLLTFPVPSSSLSLSSSFLRSFVGRRGESYSDRVNNASPKTLHRALLQNFSIRSSPPIATLFFTEESVDDGRLPLEQSY